MGPKRASPIARAPRLENWKEAEDRALCIAVMSIGGDAAVGTNQFGGTLWDRIYERFESIKPTNAPKRTQTSVESQWKKINPASMRWAQAMNKAIKNHASGENDQDDLRNAKGFYFDESHGDHFAYMHCWDILKESPKFSLPPSMDEGIGNYEMPTNLGDNNSTEDQATPSMTSKDRRERPTGQKAAKAAKKKGNQELTMSIHAQMKRLADQNDREFERREKLYEEAMAAQQREDDARTMAVDPNIYSPCKRGYWERKQKNIIEHEEMEAQNSSFHTPRGGLSSYLYLELNQTEWLRNDSQE